MHFAQPRPTGRADLPPLLAAGCSITLWASAFPVMRFVLQHYDARHLALLRVVFAALALGLYAWPAGVRLPRLRDWPIFLLFGLLAISLNGYGLAFGLKTVSAGAGSFLVGTIPIFSAVLARVFFHERLGRLGVLGITLSFAGMGLIALGEGGGLRLDWGAGLVVGAALCQSVFYVFQKPYQRRYNALSITSYAVWCGVPFMAPSLPGLADALRQAPLAVTLAAAYLGAVPLGLGYVSWNFALSRARAARVTSAMYAMPAIALSLAWLWLGEVPTLLTLAGGALALAGVVVLNLWGR
jgi:drug/metabolite transporter (DMT)-like permease